MQRRPYLASDISKLSELVNATKRDTTLLKVVLFELKFRKTNAAKQLKHRIEQLLVANDEAPGAQAEVRQPRADLVELHEQKLKVSKRITTLSELKTKEQGHETVESFLGSADSFVLESLELMRKKLLDLTARNRLLNFPIQQ